MGLDRNTENGPAAPVPILQREWEFQTLLDLYVQEAPRRVLEIGTFHGGTLFHWLTKNTPSLVVAVDSYQTGVDNRQLFEEWKDPRTQLEIIVGNSLDEATQVRVAEFGKFDWVWIDAGHFDAEVRADYAAYASLCRPGGIIALHDILNHPAHPEIQVEGLWRDVQRAGAVTRELVADPHAEWGGIGVIYR